jgi:hypothetical protein
LLTVGWRLRRLSAKGVILEGQWLRWPLAGLVSDMSVKSATVKRRVSQNQHHDLEIFRGVNPFSGEEP